MIRICVITAAYPSPVEPTRAVFLENLLGEMVAARPPGAIEVTVVAPRVHAGDPLRERRGRVRVERFRYPSSGRRLKEAGRVPAAALGVYALSGVVRAAGVVGRSGADLVYAHWLLPAGVIAALAASAARLPLVVHAHGSDVNRYAIGSAAARLAARGVLRGAAGVLAVSRDLAARLIDLGAPEERTRVVPMGVDGRLFAPSPGGDRRGDDLPRRNGRLEVLYVGDLDPWKGIVPLARAVVEDRDTAGAVRLHVVGDGVERSQLDELARASARGAIVLHGRRAQDEVARLCRQVDLLVLPSRSEGAPLAVMEALACGLPVAATPVGGIPELVHDGENGWLAPQAELPARLLRLARHRDEVEAARRRIASSSVDRSAAARAREALAVIEEALS